MDQGLDSQMCLKCDHTMGLGPFLPFSDGQGQPEKPVVFVVIFLVHYIVLYCVILMNAQIQYWIRYNEINLSYAWVHFIS